MSKAGLANHSKSQQQGTHVKDTVVAVTFIDLRQQWRRSDCNENEEIFFWASIAAGH